MSLYLKQMSLGPMENFVYLVGDTATKTCVIVDPAWEVDRALKQAADDGYTVTGALITHAHFDHCNGVEALLTARSIPLYVNPHEVEFLGRGAPRGLFGDLPAEAVKPVVGGERLTLGATTLTFLHTPGHTPGSQCFLVDGKLLAGDTLFLGTCGRCDLPGGDPRQLFDTLNGVIARLPDDTVLYPGHNYSSRGTHAPLGEEKRLNRFFQAQSLADFIRRTGLG